MDLSFPSAFNARGLALAKDVPARQRTASGRKHDLGTYAHIEKSLTRREAARRAKLKGTSSAR